MAVGFIDTAGSIYFFNNGVSAPVVGTALPGGGQEAFARTYDFSIRVTQEAVPEPMTLGLPGVGVAGIAACAAAPPPDKTADRRPLDSFRGLLRASAAYRPATRSRRTIRPG